MTASLPGRTIPDGSRASLNTLPSMTRVCPALWPPWNRTTTSAPTDSQSTILPFPSSPHWAPTTTTLAMPAVRLLGFSHVKPRPGGHRRRSVALGVDDGGRRVKPPTRPCQATRSWRKSVPPRLGTFVTYLHILAATQSRSGVDTHDPSRTPDARRFVRARQSRRRDAARPRG